VRTDLEVLHELAVRLESPGSWSSDPESVFTELRVASAGGLADYAGITYDRIDATDGVFWPCPSEQHPGTPRMFLDGFATPDRRARFVVVEHRPVAEEVDETYDVFLTTGRALQHYQSGAQTRRVRALNDAVPECYVELHPSLAASAGIEEGSGVRVTSRRGSMVGRARITDTIRPDTVFVPFHWGGNARANNVTNDALDPVSRMPEFKVCAARVEPAPLSVVPA